MQPKIGYEWKIDRPELTHYIEIVISCNKPNELVKEISNESQIELKRFLFCNVLYNPRNL